MKQFAIIPADTQEKLDCQAARISEIPLEPPGRSWPVIRLNAIPVLSWPTICRRVVCEIGGTREVREAVQKTSAKIVAVRSRAGVLGFGSDAEIRRVFAPFKITDFDCHAIETRRLHFDSTELGLLRHAFASALQAIGPFHAKAARSSHFLLLDLDRASPPLIAPLRDCAGSLSGTIGETGVVWSEALRFRLNYQLGRLWMLIEPTIYLEDPIAPEYRHIVADFVRERLATRYNRQWNSFLDAWIGIIMIDQEERQVDSFQITDGIDARFTLSRVTGFSRRRSTR